MKCVPWWGLGSWGRTFQVYSFRSSMFVGMCLVGLRCAEWRVGPPRVRGAPRARISRDANAETACGVQHPTVPNSRGDHKGHYLPTSSQQGCNCYRVCACVSRDSAGEGRPNHKRSKTTRNSQNAGAGVVGLAHACPALSFCHRITQRALQPQQGVLWLCIVPAASSRTAASFSSRSARRDETWSSVELIVS